MCGNITLLATGQALIRHPIPPVSDEDLARIIRSADIAFTNFEGTILGEHSCWPTKDSFCSAVPPETLDSLLEMGFSSLSLANNHAFDLGPGGVLATLTEVRKRGFLHAGTGEDFSSAARPMFRDYPFGRVAMVAMHTGYKNELRTCRATDAQPQFRIPARPGINCVEQVSDPENGYVFQEDDVNRNLQAIRNASKTSDFVIVYIHHHTAEETPEAPHPFYRSLCKRCVEAGADVIIGHGTPVFQGIEVFGERPIFYNISNFIFHTQAVEMWSSRHGLKPWESFIASARFSRSRGILSMEITPIVLGDPHVLSKQSPEERWKSHPRLASGIRGRQILDRLCALSSTFGVNLTLEKRASDQWQALWNP